MRESLLMKHIIQAMKGEGRRPGKDLIVTNIWPDEMQCR